MSNYGSNDTAMARGQNIRECYGKAQSDYNGSKSTEQGKKLAGDVTNLSHSLSGASAKQHIE